MNLEVRAAASRQGITRLCHLTPSRNLVHILTGGDGLLSTAALQQTERREFHQQDLERLDGFPDHISCSIEYPNAWYLRRRLQSVSGEAQLFSDWVVLTIKPDYLWADDTLFCPRNAAAANGRLVESGATAFGSLFAPSVSGAYGRDYVRTAARPVSCPTDEQAEVLIRRRVDPEDISGIVVFDEAQAAREWVRLTQLRVAEDRIRLVVSAPFFQPHVLKGLLERGERPVEQEWDHDAGG